MLKVKNGSRTQLLEHFATSWLGDEFEGPSAGQNATAALSRLLEILHRKNVIDTDEVAEVLCIDADRLVSFTPE